MQIPYATFLHVHCDDLKRLLLVNVRNEAGLLISDEVEQSNDVLKQKTNAHSSAL